MVLLTALSLPRSELSKAGIASLDRSGAKGIVVTPLSLVAYVRSVGFVFDTKSVVFVFLEFPLVETPVLSFICPEAVLLAFFEFTFIDRTSCDRENTMTVPQIILPLAFVF